MTGRQDDAGAAYAGSQLQTQLYVNRRTAELDDAIRGVFPDLDGASLQWRSPLAEDGYREYWDAGFLQRVDLDHLSASLPTFWPRGGPHWDALAVINLPGSRQPGVLLAEGKSYVNELFSSGCSAKPGSDSRERIEQSLGWTQRQLGVEAKTPQDWCRRLYQSANRLAFLCWLRSQDVQTWLVHLLFTDDPHGQTTADEWHQAMGDADQELGLRHVPTAGHVVLTAGGREDLTTDQVG